MHAAHFLWAMRRIGPRFSDGSGDGSSRGEYAALELSMAVRGDLRSRNDGGASRLDQIVDHGWSKTGRAGAM